MERRRDGRASRKSIRKKEKGPFSPTRYPNIVYYESPKRRHNGKPDRCFYIRYVHKGKRIREKVGWLSEKYTA